MSRMKRWGAAVLIAAVMAAGCASQDAAPTAPATLAPPSVIETFTGTVIALGSDMHTFSVSQLGEVDITLRSTTLQATIDATTGESIPPADPTAVPPLTLAIGTPTTTIFGLQCSPIVFGTQQMLVHTTAGSAAQLKGSALPGTFCVSLSDAAGTAGAGLLTAPVDYEIVVAHP